MASDFWLRVTGCFFLVDLLDLAKGSRFNLKGRSSRAEVVVLCITAVGDETSFLLLAAAGTSSYDTTPGYDILSISGNNLKAITMMIGSNAWQ